MLFYKVNAMLEDEKWVEENNDRRIKQERVRQIAGRSEDYNSCGKNGVFCFVSGLDDDIMCGIISYESIDAVKYSQSFFKHLGVVTDTPVVNEVTFNTIRSMLSMADHYDYIDDEDNVLERFELDRINTRGPRGIDYGENLLSNKVNKTKLYKASKDLLAEETLRPELDRIYFGKPNSKAFGHPVHYMIETDDINTRKLLYRTLLHALYDNGRIKSRRYCYVDFRPGERFSQNVYDALYKSCSEGAILVRYLARDDSDEDNNYANSEMETISAICETMKKYRNQVLTVLCLPRACEKSKAMFYENLGSMGLVEIKEDLADAEKSVGFLKMMCKDKHIRPDKNLYKDLEEDRQYLPDELRNMFDSWYNSKMKTSVYPQYKDISVCRTVAKKEVARGSAYDELKELIGLTEAKSVIEKALNYYKIQRIYKDKGIKQDRPAMHMVFTGNPGTAKTTVARLFARIMKENGLLSKGHLVEVGRSDLVGKYVGWTASIVKDKFKTAMGGVLFIDEAYSLVDDRGGSFGDEAINTIVQEMENRREDLVVIFAGYPEEMERFLDKNPGLRSRIAFHVPFADYNADELCEIAGLIGKDKGVILTNEALGKLNTIFEDARQHSGFGNGRYVRNIIELSKMNQASRIAQMNDTDLTLKELQTLDISDIEAPIIKTEKPKPAIGFSCQ